MPDSSSAANRAIAARSADVKAGRIVAPSPHSDAEWWRRAEAADRAALTKVFPQKNCERQLEPLLYKYLTAAGESMLYRLDTMKTSRSRANSWEEQAINLTSWYICHLLSQRVWRREHERLAAAAAGRHFDAMAAGEEHAAAIVDSARMILIDWALTSDRSMAAGSASVLGAASDRAMVRFSASGHDTASAMTITETFATHNRDGRLVAGYRVGGDDQLYGDEDLVRLGRRHTDGGRGLVDRTTWARATKRLSLVASRTMNGRMGMQ